MKAPKPCPPSAWITVASFHTLAAAQGLTQFLRGEGIAAEVQDERRLQKRWFFVRNPRAGVHVRVPEPAYHYAQNCLQMDPTTAERCLRQAVHCPSCGSSRVQFPQMTRKNILPTLVAQVLMLTGFMEQEYFCEACHYTWRPGARRHRALRTVKVKVKVRPRSA
ncbi:MAG TPA: hypothetical protein VNU68_03230 [Verrucomicrobiae bacterium]|nr:hypothetical protein [Verrucomicrobiae bacterium]